MRKKFLFICLSWLIALTANAVNLNLYLRTDGLTADPNSSTPYATTDKSIEEGTVVTIYYSGVDFTYTVLSIYINGEVVSSGRIMDMSYSPYTFTAKKNCILRVEGVYAFNFATNPNVYFTQDVDVTGVTLSQAEAAMTVGGETLTLTPTVAPSNATNKTVTWTSSDASVATVADGVVTAVAPGTATITATATNGTADTSDDFSATCEVTVSNPLSLSEATDNSTALTTANDKVYDVTLTRTLKAGGWNTFCVPFSTETPSGWTVKELSSSAFDSSTGELTLNFGDAASIEAGKPYLVKVTANVENPTFNGVTISNTTTTTETTAVDFVPVMNPTSLTGGDKTVLFISGGNKLTYPSADGNINGFRAYFKLKNEVAAQARAFRMSFDDDVTGIVTVLSDKTTTGSGTYTLDGRRIEGYPTQKGVYIVNGKKTIIK